MRKTAILSAIVLPAALLLSAAVSCSLDESRSTASGGRITFRAFTGALTRSEPITDLSTYTGSIRVYAYHVAAAGGAVTHYFYDDLTRTGTVWGTTSPYYWPADGSLVFFAYNSYAVGTSGLGATVNAGVDINAERGFTMSGITVPSDIQNQVDLLVGRSGNGPAGHTATSGLLTNGVPLNLVHAMSQIRIQAKCGRENMKVEVKSVKVVNIHGKATLGMPLSATNQNNGANSSGLSFDRWMDKSGTLTEFTSAFANNGTVTISGDQSDYTSLLRSGHSFMFIPQKATDGLTAWNPQTPNNTAGTYIAILCRISQSKGNAAGGGYVQLFPYGSVDTDSDGYAWTAIPITPDWEPGHVYTYNLNFFEGTGGGGGYVAPGSGEDVGESVVSGPVKFFVEINGWSDVAPSTTVTF